MNNPYSKKLFVNRNGDDTVVGSAQLHRAGSNEALIGSNGEINASNKADLMKGIHWILTEADASELSRQAVRKVAPRTRSRPSFCNG